MKRRSSWMGVLAGAVAVALLPVAPVLADGAGGRPSASLVRVDRAAHPPLGRAVDEHQLASQRGGQDDAYINDMRSRASITNTSTTNVATGNNTITDGSFVNAPGMPIVVQNSGNNVVIQNSTILNLQLK